MGSNPFIHVCHDAGILVCLEVARDVAAMSIKCSGRMKVTECARKRIARGARRVVRQSLVFPVLLQAQ